MTHSTWNFESNLPGWSESADFQSIVRGLVCVVVLGLVLELHVPIVSATQITLYRTPWLARILMASEDVTWGDRMGGESDTLVSAAES